MQAHKYFAAMITPNFPVEALWQSRSSEIGASGVCALFAAMFLAAVAFIFLARRNFTLLTFLSYKVGWGTLRGGEKSFDTIYEEVEDAYRKGLLDLKAVTKDRVLAHQTIFERTTKFWMNSVLILCGLTGLFWVQDLRSYSYVTQTELAKSGYWSLGAKIYEIEQIQAIRRNCYIS